MPARRRPAENFGRGLLIARTNAEDYARTIVKSGGAMSLNGKWELSHAASSCLVGGRLLPVLIGCSDSAP